MSGPSQKAIDALALDLREHDDGELGPVPDSEGVREHYQLLASAYLRNGPHSPELGLDRSVCLRDVVKALRRTAGGITADFIKREFGGAG